MSVSNLEYGFGFQNSILHSTTLILAYDYHTHTYLRVHVYHLPNFTVFSKILRTRGDLHKRESTQESTHGS